MSLRPLVERRSAVLLAWLSLQPRLLLPGVVLGLVLLAAVLPPVAGSVCLALVLLLAAWTTYLSWPLLASPARVLRVAVLLLLAALGLVGATR